MKLEEPISAILSSQCGATGKHTRTHTHCLKSVTEDFVLILGCAKSTVDFGFSFTYRASASHHLLFGHGAQQSRPSRPPHADDGWLSAQGISLSRPATKDVGAHRLILLTNFSLSHTLSLTYSHTHTLSLLLSTLSLCFFIPLAAPSHLPLDKDPHLPLPAVAAQAAAAQAQRDHAARKLPSNNAAPAPQLPHSPPAAVAFPHTNQFQPAVPLELPVMHASGSVWACAVTAQCSNFFRHDLEERNAPTGCHSRTATLIPACSRTLDTFTSASSPMSFSINYLTLPPFKFRCTVH